MTNSCPTRRSSDRNPLFFTRYYNSMSAPDTYAVALGSNWRHNFDRYLHIINPSAIYGAVAERADGQYVTFRSEEHTSELQSLLRISYAVFCFNKTIKTTKNAMK